MGSGLGALAGRSGGAEGEGIWGSGEGLRALREYIPEDRGDTRSRPKSPEPTPQTKYQDPRGRTQTMSNDAIQQIP